MKNNCNKVRDTCGSSILSECVVYEGTTNENSPLSEDCALSLAETTQDIYTQLEEINLSELGESCLDYVLTEDSKIIVKNVLLKYEEEICELKQKVSDLETISICNMSIVDCDLDFLGLVDACGNQPTTVKEVLQIILNNIS